MTLLPKIIFKRNRLTPAGKDDMDDDMEKDIRKTLKDILEYIGADVKYADYAQLRRWLERLIKRNQGI